MSIKLGDTIVNKSTGNSFTVIGLDGGLVISFRSWAEQSPKRLEGTALFFRIRITADPEELNQFTNFAKYVQSKYPKVSWSGTSSNHVSIAGCVDVGFSMVTPELLKTKIIELGIAKNLVGFIQTIIPALVDLSSTTFDQIIFAGIDQFLVSHAALYPGAKTIEAVVLDFPQLIKPKNPPTDEEIFG
jgi:hypothetical protein